MKSYLLPGLDAAQRQRLHDGGVMFYDWAGDTMIEEPHLQAALKILGVGTATEEPTEYENMSKLGLRFRGPEDTRPQQFPGGVDPNSPRGKSRAQYIQTCAARVQAVVEQARATATGKQSALPAALNNFAAASRAVAFTGGGTSEVARRAESVEDLQRLREMPQVKDVRVVPNYLYIFTHKLHAVNRATKVKHEIGEFLIRVRLDGRDGGVRWFNSTRRVNGVRPQMNAPNIYDNGLPCADEMVQTFLELIAQCQFAVVAELAIQFVETTNDDEVSRTLDRWPLAASA